MKYAVIEHDGRQHLVMPKTKVVLDRSASEVGSKIEFNKVLLVKDGSELKVGKPYVSGAKVSGKVLSKGRSKKVVVFKYRAKARYRRKQGHRQHQTTVEIE
jgi:large subunit ribosomal protein L21